MDAFYERAGETAYAASRATMSPWDERLQHGGPPTALLVHALTRAYPRDDVRVARVSADFLGPIPRTTLRVRTRVVRPGRRIELLEASLVHDGRDAVTARVWRIATQPAGAVAAGVTPPDAPPPLPANDSAPMFDVQDWGYWDAFAWRFGDDSRRLGPKYVWSRARIPLVAGEPPAPLERALLIADSANGISGELPMREYLFVPPSLSIAFARDPASEWILLDAATQLSDDGLGVTTLRLADTHGYVGAGTQALYVERRTG